MKRTRFLFLILVFLSITLVNGQSTENEIDANLKSLNSENAGLNLINQQILQVNQNQGFEFTGNNVSITQVGRSNLSNVATFSENSDLVLVQNGNQNSLYLDLKATTIDYGLVQMGNNNYMLEYTGASNIDLTRNISQNGNRNNLVIHGSNSITKDLKLNIQGNSKTVIIRNFN